MIILNLMNTFVMGVLKKVFYILFNVTAVNIFHFISKSLPLYGTSAG